MAKVFRALVTSSTDEVMRAGQCDAWETGPDRAAGGLGSLSSCAALAPQGHRAMVQAPSVGLGIPTMVL